MASKILSEFYSDDKTEKALVGVPPENQCYFVDFYENNIFLSARWFPGNSLRYVEDAAENYTLGIMKLEDKVI